MAYRKNGSLLRVSPQTLNLLTIVMGLAAAYFLTIQSLKIELADKAEAAVVNALDKKLSHLEVMIEEGVVSREQFYTFSHGIDARLSRIEYYLTERPGGDSGQ